MSVTSLRPGTGLESEAAVGEVFTLAGEALFD